MREGLTPKRFPFLTQLTETHRRELASLSPHRVEPRRTVLQRGDPVDGAYLVVSGSLRVYYITEGGREATLYHVEPGGACIVALSSSFRSAPYPAWVQSGPEGSSFVRVPHARVQELLGEEEVFRDFIFGALSNRVFELMRTLEETGSALMERRVARYLLRRVAADGVARGSQVAIASELGTAREVVVRALRSLVARQLVTTGRERVTVLDLRGLHEFAEPSPDKVT